MKLIKKKRILKLAEDAGLVYNTHLEKLRIFPHHAQALYDFYMLIEEEKLKNEQRENQRGISDKPEPGDSEPAV